MRVSVKFTPNQGTGEGEGLVGLQPYHFFCLQRRLYFGVPADMDNAWILPVESNKTVILNACLSWADFLPLPLLSAAPANSKFKFKFNLFPLDVVP